jgi:hypothetical protein
MTEGTGADEFDIAASLLNTIEKDIARETSARTAAMRTTINFDVASI